MKLIHCLAVVTSWLVAGAACRSDSDKPDVDAPPAGPTEKTIQNVQSDALADGSEVLLQGVIVTAIDSFGARTGNFYVQEPGGGPFSGVLVFGAKVADVATLSIGDVVDISNAEKDEFLPPGDTTGRTVTELKPISGGTMVITKSGKVTPPAPYELPLLQIAAMPAAMRDAELEKWEGVPVVARNIAQLTATRVVGSTDPTFFEFNTNGTVRVDTSLAAFPSGLAADSCLASVTGMGDYFYNYKILPRSTSEVVTGGTGCPAPEAGATACKNGMDDDLDGFPDCGDFSCQQDFTSTCQVNATVAQTQLGTYPPNAAAPNLVLLTDVFVNAVTTSTDSTRQNLKSVWVSDSRTAAPSAGVQVFVGRGTIPAEVVIGATIDVVGTVVEFDNTGSSGDKLTEITNPALRFKAAPADPLTPISGVAITVAKDIGAAGEPYEGTLMTFTNLKVTAINTTTEEVTLSDTAVPANTITVDDDIWDYAAGDYALNRCFSSVVVIASLNTAANTRMILPRSAADLAVDTTGASCMPPPVATRKR